MTRIYNVPFAAGGDREAIETDAQPDGKMSNEQGWTPDYEKLQSDPDYRPVGRKEMNGVLYELSKAVGDLQLQGFPSWEAIEWPEGAIVVRGGIIYRALTDTEEEPPSGDWERYAYVGEATESDAGTVRLATQAEAEAGSGDGVTTATRVGQAIDALQRRVATIQEAFAGTDNTTVMTPRLVRSTIDLHKEVAHEGALPNNGYKRLWATGHYEQWGSATSGSGSGTVSWGGVVDEELDTATARVYCSVSSNPSARILLNADFTSGTEFGGTFSAPSSGTSPVEINWYVTGIVQDPP